MLWLFPDILRSLQMTCVLIWLGARKAKSFTYNIWHLLKENISFRRECRRMKDSWWQARSRGLLAKVKVDCIWLPFRKLLLDSGHFAAGGAGGGGSSSILRAIKRFVYRSKQHFVNKCILQRRQALLSFRQNWNIPIPDERSGWPDDINEKSP